MPLWGLFWAVTAVLYVLAWRSGFERDFHGWLELFYYRSFPDILNRKGSGITSLYQVTQVQLWFWTWLFGTARLPWFLLMTGLHATAAALSVRFFTRLFSQFQLRGGSAVAFWGGVLFLVMPSAAEVVVWKASYHYPVAVLFCMGIMLQLQQFLIKRKRQDLFIAAALYLVSSFTLELFYATLPLCMLLIWSYRQAGLITRAGARDAVLGGLLPIAGIFLFHFLLYRVVFGGALPHVEGHVQAAIAQPGITLGHNVVNEFHLLLQGRYWPAALRAPVFRSASQPVAGWIFTSAGFLVGILLLWRFRQLGWTGRTAAWLYLAAWPGLILIMPYWVPDIGIYYNDRYLYFTALFQWQLLALALFALRPVLRLAAGTFLLLLLIGCTAFTVVQCRRAARVFWAALEGYRWKAEREPVVILNMPSNLDFVPIILASADFDEFNSHLRIFTGDSAQGRIQTVAGYNLVHWWDGVHVDSTGPGMVRVVFNQGGSWWWNGTLGAPAHENDLYRMQFSPEGFMDVTLKDTAVKVVYFNGGKWQALN